MIKRVSESGKPMGRSSFKYRERTVEDVRKRAEQSGGRFDSIFQPGFGTFRAKVGENFVRILPPTWDEHDHYGYDIWVHSRIGQDNSDYLCIRKMNGHHCPICDASDEARAGGEVDESKALQANHKVVMWLIDRDADNQTPILWVMTWSADRDISLMTQDRRKGKVWLLDHPDDGYDLIVRRTGQGIQTRYTYQVDRDPSPIMKDEKAQDEILDFIMENPVPSILLFRDEGYLKKVLAGAVVEKDEDLDEKPRSRRARDDDDDEEEKPRSRRARNGEDEDEEKPARSRRAARDDDDDEEEEKPRSRRARVAAKDDDDDEEEEKPKSRRARVAAKDDDDDEEDEKPRSRRARVAAKDDDDDEEDEKPRSRRVSTRDDDDDEEEKPRSRRARDDDDDRPRNRR